MQSIIERLIKIGFSEKEAQIYFALFDMRKASAQEIAKRTDIARASVYAILDHLIEKGLVTTFHEKGDRRFRAESPRHIEQLLSLQQQELAERQIIAKGLIKKMRAFQGGGDKPSIRYFEGLKGLRRMQQEYELMSHDLIQLIGYDAFIALHDAQVTKQHHQSLSKQDRRVRSILITDRRVDFPHLKNEIRYISPSLVEASGEMTVCGDRAVFFSYASDIVAIEIISRPIAETVRAALELAWSRAGDWK